MLNKISAYLSDGRKRILNQLLQKKKPTSVQGLCCIGIAPQEFTLVYAREVAGKITIELCETHPYKDTNTLLATLTSLIKDHDLKNLPCSLMLQPEDYQLLVTDELPVNAVEFQAAIRWKIKELLRFSLDDVVIDSFTMPKMKTNQNKIMVVAAQASKLKTISDQIRSCGLDLTFIDIPELGLRNIAILYEQGEQTTALIYVQDTSIQLLIIYKQSLFVSRLLKFSLNNENAGTLMQGIERLAPEVQRSIDYYQNLWDQPLPSRFIFAATKEISTEAITLLSQRIKMPVEIFNITDTMACVQQIPITQQGKSLPVIGGTLRESFNNATKD